MGSANFKFKVCGDILWVTLEGQWNLGEDIKYLTALSDHMAQMRQQSWGMVVDMRQWHNGNRTDTLQNHQVAQIPLDRRNQLAEAWLVREDSQEEVLVPFIKNQAGLKFIRSRNKMEIEAWLNSQGLSWKANCC